MANRTYTIDTTIEDGPILGRFMTVMKGDLYVGSVEILSVEIRTEFGVRYRPCETQGKLLQDAGVPTGDADFGGMAWRRMPGVHKAIAALNAVTAIEERRQALEALG